MILDALIIGGGIAGLWTLHELTRRGRPAILVERTALGHGQTIASQGILHSGVKYSLGRLIDRSQEKMAAAANSWRTCFDGRHLPHLSRHLLRSDHCHLWQTDSIRSHLVTLAARIALAVTPTQLPAAERPPALRSCPGPVFRLDELVIDPAAVLAALAKSLEPHLLHLDPDSQMNFTVDSSGHVSAVTLRHPTSAQQITIHPRWLILTAGAGNQPLRRMLGKPSPVMQRRPLHMTVVSGEIPILNGHCIDGARTRVTITTAVHSPDRTIWQIGGQLAEDGVRLNPADQVERARNELTAVLPDVDFAECDFTTYRIDRAEQLTRFRRRPRDVSLLQEANTITAWPTKLVLAPRLAEKIAELIDDGSPPSNFAPTTFASWPRPTVAEPPWHDEIPSQTDPPPPIAAPRFVSRMSDHRNMTQPVE